MGDEDLGSLKDLAPRPRQRRDVKQLFDALQNEEKPQARVVTNSLGMKLVLISAGTFSMGATDDDAHGRLNEKPRHEVLITQPFYLAETVVTQSQYQKLMGKNPARFPLSAGGGPDHPVEQVSWTDAAAFCAKLSSQPDEQSAGRVYRLPREAEWEYACRAGEATAFAFGATLTAGQANFAHEGSAGKTKQVARFPSNNFGLFDMHGNVWEWCSDWYGEDYYKSSPSRDPQGPAQGKFRVARGGCWRSHAATCRAAYRNALVPHNRDPYTGFRVACTLAAKTE